MGKLGKGTGRASSVAAGLTAGILSSLVIIIIGSAITAKMIESEYIPESSIGYGVMVFLIAAAYAGSRISNGRIKRRRLMVTVLSGSILFAVLLSITALFFDGQYSAVGVTALLIICGCGLSLLPQKQHKRVGKARKLKIPAC